VRVLAGAWLILLAAILVSQPSPREQVGPVPGGYLLNSGWTIRPAGKQTPLDTFPMSMALAPDGKHLLVLNAGYRPPSISVLDLASAAEIGRTPVPDGWLGLAFAPNSELVYAGGGSQAAVFEFRFRNGRLEPARTFPVVPEEKRTHRDFIGDVAFPPAGRLLYAADLFQDSIVVINPQSGRVIERFKTGRRPYRILFHPDGKSFFVSSWTDGAVYHHNADDGALLSRVRLAPHPTDMVWREGKAKQDEGEEDKKSESWYSARLFVAAASTNTVQVVGVSDSKVLRVVESVNVALTPRQPLGMTPSALAVSADGSRLFVACSDAHAVAVADISGARSRVLGFLPTGWYPTAVRSLADGRLVVLNGKGVRSYPNPKGPNPTVTTTPLHLGSSGVQYVGLLQTGTASFIGPLDEDALERHTKSVYDNSPYRDSKLDDARTGEKNPVPSSPGAPTPIEHVIYIVKENRTYDQVLGDMKEGNGDASLVLFGEEITPNQHKLAREFVLFDNFYVNSEVSADGHHWSTAAIVSDYV